MAQAIAYTALFALVPLTLVGVAMLAFVYGTQEGITRAHAVIELYVPQIQDLVAANLDAIVRYRGLTGIIGAIGLMWSGKNLFQALTYALNKSLGVERFRHFVWDVAIALVLVPFVGVILIVATVLPVAITLLVQFTGLESLRWVPQISSYATSLVLVFAVSTLLYAYLPNRAPHWGSVFLGAAVCAALYSLAQIAFAMYTTYAASAFAIYGALSALVVLLLWLYLIGIIFLFSAHVSAAWEQEAREGALRLAS